MVTKKARNAGTAIVKGYGTGDVFEVREYKWKKTNYFGLAFLFEGRKLKGNVCK